MSILESFENLMKDIGFVKLLYKDTGRIIIISMDDYIVMSDEELVNTKVEYLTDKEAEEEQIKLQSTMS